MNSVPPAVFPFEALADWPSHGASLTPPARLAVIGDPIAHSKSPQMHNPALLAAGIDAQYVRVQVPVGQVAEALEGFKAAGFWGINVTIPHKFEALAAVDWVDPLAQTLGAVNTVAITPDGLKGYNSDGPGFLRSVEEGFGKKAGELRVLILGAAGGAGRAVAVQCALVGTPKLFLANRTAAKAEQLLAEIEGLPGAEKPQVHCVGWDDDSLAAILPEVDVVVNASPLGMKDGDAAPVPTAAVRPQHLLFDMVYRADGALTSLGTVARDSGASYVDGRLLLLHQGAISFEHWFQQPAPLEVMRVGLASALGR